MKRGRKVNTFTVEEALDLFDRAGNDDQRREALDRLTLAKLREFAKEQGIELEFNIKKELVVNLIMEELLRRTAELAEQPEAEEPELEVKPEPVESSAERKARLQQEMKEREAAAAAAELEELLKEERQKELSGSIPLNRLRKVAGVSQVEVAEAIGCELDDYLNVEYFGRGKGLSQYIAAKARAYLERCINQDFT